MQYFLAIDMGASSGRHILGHVEDGRMVLEEVWRFENRQLEKDGHVCWDTQHLWQSILDGMKECARIGKIPVSLGIDTWGVDYVLLDAEGQQVGDAVAYRDERTRNMAELVDQIIPEEQLYERTGIQRTLFNTIYQLMALKGEHPEDLERAQTLLFTPDYYHYRLTGVPAQEYTMATTTGLVNAKERTWDMDLIRQLGLPEKLFGPLSMPGTVLGRLSEQVQQEVGFDCDVVLPATHDTESAFLAVPAGNDTSVFLSSGTWSLLGVENEQAITTPESCHADFTNEGTAGSRYCYLRNIMGLWIIQSIRRELNGTAYIEGHESRHKTDRTWSFPELSDEARAHEDFTSVVDINEDRFMAPESMIDEIRAACRDRGQAVPESVGEIMQCAYSSLAECYRGAITQLQEITGTAYTDIHIVGGGCQDRYLNERTASACGLPVHAGPIEGTAIGNILMQMITAGTFADLSAARACIHQSFPIVEF